MHSDAELNTSTDNTAAGGECESSEDERELASATGLHLSVPERIIVLLLLATKFRHNLTYTAAECFMKLAGVLSKASLFAPYKHILKTAIREYSSALSEHHICPHCGTYVGVIAATKECHKCHKEINAKEIKKEGNVFLYLSVAEQIKSLLINGLASKLIKPEHRQKIKFGNYEDIMDGKFYKKLVALGVISFNFFVDGLKVRLATYPLCFSYFSYYGT